MPQKRKSKHPKTPIYHISNHVRPLLTIIILLILVLYGFLLTRNVQKPLSMLPIPTISHIDLPGGLMFPFPEGPVLGAQIFDPIDIVTLVNKEREKTNAKPLRLNTTLMNAAKMRADVILKHQNFSHQDPYEHIELATVLPKLNYHFVYATENIGMDGGGPETFINGFMSSPPHRENLLNPALTDTGIAMVIGHYQKYYVNIVVQLFAVPGGQDEYLGYNQNDRELYEQSLQQLKARLNPIIWTVQKMLHNPSYTDERYTILVKQKELLEEVCLAMRKGEPFSDRHVIAILSYNNMLN